jgi:hypothetical protein
MRSKIKVLLVALSLSGGLLVIPQPVTATSCQYGNSVPPPSPSYRDVPPPSPRYRDVPPPSGAQAQSLDPETISKIAATTRSLCLSGSQYDLQVSADGSLSLLKLEPSGQGKIRITKSTGTGGALNYQDEGKRVEADEHIIDCITQNLPVLLTAAGARLAPPEIGNISPGRQPWSAMAIVAH